jgi:hypothetical protein
VNAYLLNNLWVRDDINNAYNGEAPQRYAGYNGTYDLHLTLHAM